MSSDVENAKRARSGVVQEIEVLTKQTQADRDETRATIASMHKMLTDVLAQTHVPFTTRLDSLEKRVAEMDKWAGHIGQLQLLQKRVSELEQSCALMQSKMTRKRRDDYDYAATE
jgi:hypothetical protein